MGSDALRSAILVSILVLLGSCKAPAPAPAESTRAQPSAPTLKLGAPLSAAPVVRLVQILNAPQTYANQRVQTEGTIRAVCQRAGCWMEIADDVAEAHVKMYGHRFAIPHDATGRRARVAATVVGAPARGTCEEEAAQQVGKLSMLQLEATGVELY
jgi:hypothetical protein